MTGKGVYVSSGFSIPTDADAVEISLWMPLRPIIEPQIDVEMAKYIIKNVGNRFCELVEQEKEAMSWIASNGKQFTRLLSFRLPLLSPQMFDVKRS